METEDPAKITVAPVKRFTRFLLNYKTKEQIPLYHVNAEVKIENNIAELKYQQFYFNHSTEPVEAEYIFPVHADAVFGGLELKHKDKVIFAGIEGRETAKAKYDDSIAAGKTAVISHPSRVSDDIVRLNVGGIPPKSQIVLVCTFYQTLEVEDLSWSLMIPSKIIPRYMGNLLSYIETGHHLEGAEDLKTENTDMQDYIDDIEETYRDYYQKNNFTWSINLILNSTSAFERIACLSHEINAEFLDETRKEVRISLKDQSIKSVFETDFKLLFRNEEVNRPMVLAQKLGDEYALTVSFLADITPATEVQARKSALKELVDMDSSVRYARDSNLGPAEFYFVLDRSGSMSGSRISVAKEALKLFVRSIPPGSMFNVVSFGSKFKWLFRDVTYYDKTSFEYAIDTIDRFRADMGGTEIYMPLKSLFDKKDSHEELEKHVYLITDGQVSNTNDVIKLINTNNSKFTVHTFGIGDGVSTDLIIKCARAGRGKYYFADGSANGLQEKVIDALCKAFEPSVEFEKQEQTLNGTPFVEFPKFPNLQNKVYHGDYFIYSALINKLSEEALLGKLNFTFTRSDSKEQEHVEIDLTTQLKVIPGDSMFKLIAKQYIKELENKYQRDKAIEVSVKYQVPCQSTSFFAAERFVCPQSNLVQVTKLDS